MVEYTTTDIKLAAWLLYQDGARIKEVATEVVQAPVSGESAHTRAIFTIELHNSDVIVESFVEQYNSREDFVEVRKYEGRKKQLVMMMRASRSEILRGD